MGNKNPKLYKLLKQKNCCQAFKKKMEYDF